MTLGPIIRLVEVGRVLGRGNTVFDEPVTQF